MLSPLAGIMEKSRTAILKNAAGPKSNIWMLAKRISHRPFHSSACLYGTQAVPLLKKTVGMTIQTPLKKDSTNSDDLSHLIDSIRSKQLSWATPGPAQFDFRSDVVTTPTISMLQAIMTTTLLDDVYREDPTTLSLEAYISSMMGKQDGAFVLSGTMSNQIALRTHLTQPPHAVLCDARAHIVHWEAGGLASLCGAMIQGVAPRNGEYLTLEDIQRKAILSDDVHRCPTRVIALENTISGLIHPLTEVQRISAWARQHDVRMHLDGARLWEAVAAGGGSLLKYAKCFDSVAVDFSKGLGSPMGAMIVGDNKFIAQARRIRKSVGGGMRQAGVLTAAARAAVDDMFISDTPGREGAALRKVHQIAEKVAELWTSKGGCLLRRTETNLVWINLKVLGLSEGDFQQIGSRHGIRVEGCRIVLHYQISKEALRRLELTFAAALNHDKAQFVLSR